MRKLIAILFISQISIFSVLSQETSKDNLSHYIGAAAGVSTGFGLSYRYWPGDLGTQIVFTPITDGSETMINLGSAGFKTLYETKNTKLFLYLAANGSYVNNLVDTWSQPADGETWENFESEIISTERVITYSGTIGIGPGLEIYILKNIVLDIMFGYKYSIGEFINPEGLGFTAEAALYYRF